MPTIPKKPSEFSRTEYTEWLNARRSELGLPSAEVPEGSGRFMAWVRDAWPWIKDLPEAQGLTLLHFGERGEIACEYRQSVEIAGQAYDVSVYELLFAQRPPTAEKFSESLRKVSKTAESVREDLQEDVPHQVRRVRKAMEKAVEKDPAVLHEETIQQLLQAFTAP